jgi:hypothetical protein
MKSKSIITQTTSNSMLINGVFFNGKDFVDKYNNILKHTWVVLCYWTIHNSKSGDEIADLQTAKFCEEYGIENKKW